MSRLFSFLLFIDNELGVSLGKSFLTLEISLEVTLSCMYFGYSFSVLFLC